MKKLEIGWPAMAVSSMWFTENIHSQSITHTPQDNTEIVDCARLVEIARALSLICSTISNDAYFTKGR